MVHIGMQTMVYFAELTTSVVMTLPACAIPIDSGKLYVVDAAPAMWKFA
jgi:hypothetical protein